jgi:hypothetical protein
MGAFSVASDCMKILVQQVATGLFLKRYPVWVRFKEEAKVFGDVAAAIKQCLSLGIRDVRLGKFTDTWKLEGYLQPFGATGLDLSNEKIVAELRKSIEENRALREKQRELKMKLDHITAELKEWKKQRPFKRKRVSDDPPEDR